MSRLDEAGRTGKKKPAGSVSRRVDEARYFWPFKRRAHTHHRLCRFRSEPAFGSSWWFSSRARTFATQYITRREARSPQPGG